MKHVLRTAAFVLLFAACAWQTHAAEVEGFVEYAHLSDLTRGFPFNTKDETTVGYIGGGVTITVGANKRFEIDMSHGAKWFKRGEYEQGSHFAVRYYPGRNR